MTIRLAHRNALVACVLALAAAGCSEARDSEGAAPAGEGGGGGATATGAFTLHLDQVVQSLEQGRNVTLEGYRSRLDNCRKAGIAARGIPESEEHLIGTGRWRMWRDNERYAYRTEYWHVGQPENPASREDLCTFTLERTGEHGYVDARRAVSVDLATGERTEGEGNPGIVLTGPGAGTGDGAGQAGALQGPTRTSVAGQPCDRWQARQGATLCVWSGGTRWGFSGVADSEFLVVDGLRPDHIVLEADPPPDAIGDELRTTLFVVGAPLDQGAMEPRD